jgi:hypothetical protein
MKLHSVNWTIHRRLTGALLGFSNRTRQCESQTTLITACAVVTLLTLYATAPLSNAQRPQTVTSPRTTPRLSKRFHSRLISRVAYVLRQHLLHMHTISERLRHANPSQRSALHVLLPRS